jgi:hypothetical protein
VLLSSLRRFLGERWRIRVYDDWKRRKTEDPDGVRQFLDSKLEPFAGKFLDPLDPATRGQVICGRAQSQIDNARHTSAPKPDAGAAPVQAPPPSKFRPPRITVKDCDREPQEVIFDAAGKGRFLCDTSTHLCEKQKVVEGSEGTAVARVEAHFKDSIRPGPPLVQMAGPCSFETLIEKFGGPDANAHVRTLGFRGPGKCHTYLYLDPAMIDAARPSKPTLKVTLPETLTCP